MTSKHEIDVILGLENHTKVFEVFEKCSNDILNGINIKQVSSTDKEFHFQNWFQERLEELDVDFESQGRNSYPDFKLPSFTESYEIKGLAHPGRESTYDCNSQVPTGYHDSHDVYYVFGRYPRDIDGLEEYPVIDFVICHGNFLNSNHNYVHRNTNVKGFGSFGDIMIRDRKMYVAYTPYAIVDGLVESRTLIVPDVKEPPDNFKKVGELVRRESEEIVVGYQFDLVTNEMETTMVPNPTAGIEHKFSVFRIDSDSDGEVSQINTGVDDWFEIDG